VSTNRESFLQRVRQAVAEGNRAGAIPSLPQRGTVGYQGAGADPVARLRQEFTSAGGHVHLVTTGADAVAAIIHLVRDRSARRILLGDGAFFATLRLERALTDMGLTVYSPASLPMEHTRAAFFAADVGITGVDHLIAETGTVVLETRPGQPRSLSLLPPMHIVVAHREQLVADLFDLFAERQPSELPSCLSLITGPSKTGDIELRLVTGVHGPGELHLVLVTG
jgi:L-lactate utilization protein LutC